jgi:hypothetical protein
MFGIHSLPLYIVSCITLNPKVSLFSSFLSAPVRRPRHPVNIHPVFTAGDDLFNNRQHLVSSAGLRSDLDDWQAARPGFISGDYKKATGTLFVGLGIKLAISGVQ